jgi:hypothetical protein
MRVVATVFGVIVALITPAVATEGRFEQTPVAKEFATQTLDDVTSRSPQVVYHRVGYVGAPVHRRRHGAYWRVYNVVQYGRTDYRPYPYWRYFRYRPFSAVSYHAHGLKHGLPRPSCKCR